MEDTLLPPPAAASPSPSPASPAAHRPAIVLLSPRQSESPPPLPPAPRPAPRHSVPTIPSPTLLRAVALRSYLDRRLQTATASSDSAGSSSAIPRSSADRNWMTPSPPRELDDWREVQERSTADLEDELRELMREANSVVGVEDSRRAVRRIESASTLVLSDGESSREEDEDEEALFIASLVAGGSSRRRRRRLNPAGEGRSLRTLFHSPPPPSSQQSTEEARGQRTYPLPRRTASRDDSQVIYRSTQDEDESGVTLEPAARSTDNWGLQPFVGDPFLGGDLNSIWDEMHEDMTAGGANDDLSEIWGASPLGFGVVNQGDETSSTAANTNNAAPVGFTWADEVGEEETDYWDETHAREMRDALLNRPGDQTDFELSSSPPPLLEEPDVPRVWRHTPIDITRGGATSNARGGRPLYESYDELEWRRRSQAPPPLNSDLRTTLTDWTTMETSSLPSITTRQRNLYEATFLIGQALRSKKDVHLIYCGGKKSDNSSLPNGFKWDEGQVSGGGEECETGCGTLICARGLSGARSRIYEERRGEEATVSSDLPPPIQWVGDVKLGPEEERGGARGCEGCRTKDIGCKACGNVVGFRVVRPCDHCATSRAIADGLLWHFRAASITLRHRLNQITPSPTLSPLASPPASPTSSLNPASGRLETVDPAAGSKMLWRHLPAPQIDFEEGLLSEPGEWIVKGIDNWWLENGIARHCREDSGEGVNGLGSAIRRDNSRRGGWAGWAAPARSSLADLSGRDSSNAETSANNDPIQDAVPENIFSPRRPLQRASAIRLPNRSSGDTQGDRDSGGAGTTRSLDDGQNRRRVRARLAFEGQVGEQHVDETDNEVDRTLLNAGYGSAYRSERRGRVEELRRRRDGVGVSGRRSPAASTSVMMRAGR